MGVTLVHATLTNNNGGNTQLWCVSSKATPALKNSIIWSGKGQARTGSGCSFEGSDLDENLGGNNYSADPLFIRPIALPGPQNCVEYSCLDYRLRVTSYCLDHGVTLATSLRPLFDLDGDPRKHGPKPDSGAYEY